MITVSLIVIFFLYLLFTGFVNKIEDRLIRKVGVESEIIKHTEKLINEAEIEKRNLKEEVTELYIFSKKTIPGLSERMEKEFRKQENRRFRRRR